MFLSFKEPNKQGGWNLPQKLIKGEALIKVSRVEKNPKINKWASPFIRKVRVERKILNFHDGLQSYLLTSDSQSAQQCHSAGAR